MAVICFKPDFKLYNNGSSISAASNVFQNPGTAQQLLSNPVVAEAAMQYGQGLVNMGQSYLDQNVRTLGIDIYSLASRQSCCLFSQPYDKRLACEIIMIYVCVGESICTRIKEILRSRYQLRIA